jgi:hypothetical protein
MKVIGYARDLAAPILQNRYLVTDIRTKKAEKRKWR